jgi:hypothetical protein
MFHKAIGFKCGLKLNINVLRKFGWPALDSSLVYFLAALAEATSQPKK